MIWKRVWGALAAAICFVGCSMQELVLVKDGAPQATIVLPDQANETERKAADVLVKYLKMASGATLPIVKESEKHEGTLISIGRTRMAEAAGISAKDLRYDGYHLQTKNGVLYILGRDMPRTPKMSVVMGAQGTWRAALGFLERLGCRWIQPTDKGVHVPELKTVAIPDDLRVTVNPPFMNAVGRMTGLGDWSMANNLRSSVNLYTLGGHTWCAFVPATLWETHPEYFQMRNGKRVKPEGDGYFLCPSNPDVQKLLADGIRKKFDEGYEMVQLGQSDSYRPCECETCRALDKPGECQEQVHIPHYNVIKMVQQTHPDKMIHMLIYPPTNKPSAKIDKYPGNVMGEVCLTWTTAQAFVGSDNFDRAKLAKGHEEALKFWAGKMPAGNTVYVYYFGTYHTIGLAPKTSPKRMAEEIQRLHRNNVKGVYFCGGGENWGAEGPCYYVAARMMSEPTQDWNVLVDEYCDDTFGSAAKTMRAYYVLLYTQIENAPFTSPNGMAAFTATYPMAFLDMLDELLKKAKGEAAADQRASGWLRLVEMSQRHYSLLARAYHYYEAYQNDPTPDTFKKVKQAVLDYQALADEIENLNKTDPAFVRDYFCSSSWGSWLKHVRTNGGMGGANLGMPFTWNFAELAKTNSMPGGVLNPSFESTDIEIKAPRDWHLFPPADVEGRCFIDQGTARDGQKSLYFKFGPNEKGNSFVAYQHVPRKYKTGQKFTFSCWVKTRDLKGSAYIGIMRYPIVKEDKAVISSKKTLSGDNDWTLVKVTFPVREGMGETSIRCHVGGTSGEAWFDDAKFEEAKEGD